MNRRQLAKTSVCGALGYVLAKVVPEKEGVPDNATECICRMQLPIEGYSDTVWVNVFRPPGSNDIAEYHTFTSIGLPTMYYEQT